MITSQTKRIGSWLTGESKLIHVSISASLVCFFFPKSHPAFQGHSSSQEYVYTTEAYDQTPDLKIIEYRVMMEEIIITDRSCCLARLSIWEDPGLWVAVKGHR